MAKFYVGQRVRFVAIQDPSDFDVDEIRAIDSQGVIVGPGRTFETYEDSYDWLVALPVYSDGAYCAYSWQLEPIQPDSCHPSKFTTLADLLTSLGAEAKA